MARLVSQSEFGTRVRRVFRGSSPKDRVNEERKNKIMNKSYIAKDSRYGLIMILDIPRKDGTSIPTMILKVPITSGDDL